MNMIRKLFILTVVIIALTACGKSKKENKNNEVQEVKESIVADEETYVKLLNYKDFTKEIWDFEKYPDSFALKSDIPCIIDFYADWCGPCRKIAPIMEELAKEYEGKVKIYKVNTENERKLATIFEIRSIPTVFFLPVEGQPRMQIGGLSKEEYKNIINQHLIK